MFFPPRRGARAGSARPPVRSVSALRSVPSGRAPHASAARGGTLPLRHALKPRARDLQRGPFSVLFSLLRVSSESV